MDVSVVKVPVEVPLISIKVGETFQREDRYYMRITSFSGPIAVDLETGELKDFNESARVVPIKLMVVLKDD